MHRPRETILKCHRKLDATEIDENIMMMTKLFELI